MKTIAVIERSELKDIIISELKKRDHLITKNEIRLFIKDYMIQKNKMFYNELDKLRRRLNELEVTSKNFR